MIAKFPVVAEWKSPDTPKPTIDNNTEAWKRSHVLQTQYSLQIRRCSNLTCCAKDRTNFRSILPDGFIPPPVPFTQTNKGLRM